MPAMRDKVCSAAEAVGYTTERAMLELTGDGLLLTEIAPGIDARNDIRDQMAFKPAIADNLKNMSEELFNPPRPPELPDDLGQDSSGC